MNEMQNKNEKSKNNSAPNRYRIRSNACMLILFVCFILIYLLVCKDENSNAKNSKDMSSNTQSSNDKNSIDKSSSENGLFLWKSEVAFKEKNQLFQMMKDQDINSLYQEFQKDVSIKKLSDFIKAAKAKNISVHWLAGTPEWGLETFKEDLFSYVDKVIKINQKLPKNNKLSGMVLDIEPYLLKEWSTETNAKMKSFVTILKEVYIKISESGMNVIVCIPYYYDTNGFESELEEIIANACDSVAVMNYYKSKEQEHIFNEMELAKKYEKGIIQVYETQEPGEHDLTFDTTYYEDGIKEVEKSFASLSEYYQYEKFRFAIHEYESLKKVMQKE